MPFGLKNAPLEFQNIMNDIFNPYTTFTIVYIDDVLVYSNSWEQNLKHINIFLKVVKNEGLIVSAKKMKLFQTKIRFLGHNMHKGLSYPLIEPLLLLINFQMKF